MTDRFLREGRTALVELNDLKRIVSAGRAGSIATRLFEDAWACLVGGAPIADAAWWITGRALAAARLGDIDRKVMSAAGLSFSEMLPILCEAADQVAPPFAMPAKAAWHAGLAATPLADLTRLPTFVSDLSRQPRAGITCPGKPRVLLEPAENHAEHCLMVAVYGVLLAPHYDAEPATVFVAALAHHFHNAGMPDSGFTGEMLLGPHLDRMVAFYTQACLDQLASPLREAVTAARAILPDADTPEGRAFHAADVLDRVLQTVQYTRAGSLTTDQMLGEMELVHAGPVKLFQDDVLRQAGLS